MPGADHDQPTILIVGSTMIDMIAYADRVPEAGETLVGNTFSIGFGGKGANQAVMCALLGASVRFVGCLGQDLFGQMTLENLNSFGIDTASVTYDGRAATGAAPIWVDGTGENRIIIVPGANNLLDPDAVETAVRSTHADVVLTQLELLDSCVERALRTADAVGSISILNPAPMRPVGRELLALSTWLIPNRPELEATSRLLSVPANSKLHDLASRCAAELDSNLVVTLGADGALLCDRDGGSPSVVKARSTAAVDTTGAGDAFVGAFAYAIAVGSSPDDAAAFGCACATASVEAPGTQTSFPRGERLEELKRTLRLSPHEAPR